LSKTINIILEVLGFLLLITAVMPSFYGDQTPQAILGAVLIIYSLSRKVLVKLDA
jgi:hypothetical protein